MGLTEKKCVPCEGGMPALSEDESKELLAQVPSWDLKGGHVYKKFSFKDFREAMQFVNRVAEVAASEGHHPGIMIHYNQVEIELWTHAVNGLSKNDFIVAAKIEKL
jgi:4a-hydroxytetrahydrobiopterin dehydratase